MGVASRGPPQMICTRTSSSVHSQSAWPLPSLLWLGTLGPAGRRGMRAKQPSPAFSPRPPAATSNQSASSNGRQLPCRGWATNCPGVYLHHLGRRRTHIAIKSVPRSPLAPVDTQLPVREQAHCVYYLVLCSAGGQQHSSPCLKYRVLLRLPARSLPSKVLSCLRQARLTSAAGFILRLF